MDTLFRLVSLQSSDDSDHRSGRTSTTTTTSSKSSTRQTNNNIILDHPQYNYYYNHNNYQRQQQPPYSSYFHHNNNSSSTQEEDDQEECCNNHVGHLYMDEDQDHFSSSSTNPNPSPNHPTTIPDFSLPQSLNLNLDFSSSSSSTSSSLGGPRWASDLLIECARAVADRDTPKVQQLMWMLNELSSPYGDTDQKLASYFLQALFAKLTNSGPRTLATLTSASDQTTSFDSTRRVALRFQELSPWSSFGHVAANGAILEAFLDSASSSQRLHILDLSNTFCTQWPTLLEALATRSADDTPHLTITTVVAVASPSSTVQRVMKEIGARMEKFARLMGVPFKFNIVHHAGDLSTLDLDQLDLASEQNQNLAVNCINSLHSVSPSGTRRADFITALRRLRPRIVTVVEEEAELDDREDDDESASFVRSFKESLRFFRSYMDSLEESFPRTSNERLALERSAGRAVMDLVACPASESAERREAAAGWARRMREVGFESAAFSDDVVDDVRALLRRYKEGWGMKAAAEDAAGIWLTWKEVPVVWASAWRMG